MSVKEDIKVIKQELSTEEQFLESIIKGERFFKKYKLPLILFITILLVCLAGYGIYDFIKEQNLKTSNEAYIKVLENPADLESLKILENKNQSLFLAYKFQQAIINNDKKSLEDLTKTNIDPFLKDLASYESNSQNSILLEDLNFALKGYNLLKEGKIQDANNEFSKIALSSPIQNIVKNLQHYKMDIK